MTAYPTAFHPARSVDLVAFEQGGQVAPTSACAVGQSAIAAVMEQGTTKFGQHKAASHLASQYIALHLWKTAVA